jgi:hypothetical protein
VPERMPADHRPIAPIPGSEAPAIPDAMPASVTPVQASRVTNGDLLFPFVDGRSAEARRYRDLVRVFGAECGGGFERLSESDRQLVRRVALVSLQLEWMESNHAAGNPIDAVSFVRLVNTQRRLLRDLDRVKSRLAPEKPKGSAFQRHLAERAAAKAADEGTTT